MKPKNFITILIASIMTFAMMSPALASSSVQSSLAQVRRANAKYHNPQVAMAAGYNYVHANGLDTCFDNPGVGGMGYHLINTSLIDNKVDPLKPEALVYAPGPNGQLELVAVEYIVPITSVDQAPVLFGHTFERLDQYGTYSLHAWIFRGNSLGLFNDWNPKVSCNP
jgi:hypothetical protein